MPNAKYALISGMMETLYFSGAYRLLQPFLGGAGAILMLHHVRPERQDAFQPNKLLEITPAFLEVVVRQLRQSDVDIISLDEMHRRLTMGKFPRRFVCLTFDDGYRDNLEFAYPILKKYDVPFTVYVASHFADRMGELWWVALEAAIARNDHVTQQIDGTDRTFEMSSSAQKQAAFDHIYRWLRGLPAESDLRRAIRELSARCGVELPALCSGLCMDWAEIKTLAQDPLVTIGAHTVTHPILAKVDETTARRELEECRTKIETMLGVRPRHLAYPVGDRSAAGPREFKIAAELGFATAVTTRPGVVFPQHVAHLTALPRISLNGEFQRSRYAEVLMSGAATALWNGFRPVNVT
jgi:peptidoglycan/xylan/chitin deacetylase (PgdA/CDA1 family)